MHYVDEFGTERDYVDEAIEAAGLSAYRGEWGKSNIKGRKALLNKARKAIINPEPPGGIGRFLVLSERRNMLRFQNAKFAQQASDTLSLFSSEGGGGAGSAGILVFGFNAFREDVWDIRINYVYPDLFDPLKGHCSITMLFPRLPEHAKPSLEWLAKRYSLNILTFDHVGPDKVSDWFSAAEATLLENPDIGIITNVQGHTFFGPVMAHLRRRNNVRAVLRVAGDEVEAKVALLALGRFESAVALIMDEVCAVRASDLSICMSSWEKERLAGWVREENRIEVIHRGVAVDKFKEPDRWYEDEALKSGERRILYLGRKSSEKGWDKVASLADESWARNAAFEFWFAGPGFEIKKVRNQRYVGFVKPCDLPELLGGVDALVLLSTSESLGQVLLEAFAAGKPCFVDDQKYFSMFGERRGLVFLEEDPRIAVSSMLRFFEQEDLEEVSRELVEYAETNLDRTVMGRRYRQALCGDFVA